MSMKLVAVPAAALALIVAGLVALARLTREEDSDPDYARVE
jgi:hypothetical protein